MDDPLDDPLEAEPLEAGRTDEAAAGFALPESLPWCRPTCRTPASGFLASPFEASVLASTLAGVSPAAFLSRLSLR